ncbi:unnamed protein product [Didymodactylos carnosus]|uniref:Homeobox domain-containing protein n=1 Tax=Didymodactylos carnosus TaxID=1234261 RepID=A0A814YHC9_9BILA|nr:unnamed protein product [Didymodactylos carnosus]CAF1229539.1 unnamed protein product [Didymodactylos carnosus]CAF3810127.1 unnamed protein product [Didymodactylos carnosus]CAF3992240.1 unnamed protein product [Didymodactylos carnosus]
MSDYQPYAYNFNNLNLSSITTPNGEKKLTDSGFISRTPTPPTPLIQQDENDEKEPNSNCSSDKADIYESKSFTYRKRSRIQYTAQQLQTLEATFKSTHYPEVAVVDQLAELLNVQHEKISNRRSRFKRQQKCKTTRKNAVIPLPLDHTPAYENIQNYPSPPSNPTAGCYYYHYPHYQPSWNTSMNSNLQWSSLAQIDSSTIYPDSTAATSPNVSSIWNNFSNPTWQDYYRATPLTDIQR